MTTTVACNSLEDCEAVIQAVKATGQPETFAKLGRLERYADSLRPDPYAGASRVDRWGELSGGGGRRGGQAGLVSRIQLQESHALMAQLGVNGYPTLLIEDDQGWQKLPHASFYGREDAWEQLLSDIS